LHCLLEDALPVDVNAVSEPVVKKLKAV
jgi:hypothetical protein